MGPRAELNSLRKEKRLITLLRKKSGALTDESQAMLRGEVKPEGAEEIDPLESFVLGLGNPAGFGDEIYGAVHDPTFGDTYREKRDEARGADALSWKTNPKSHLGGALSQAAATVALTRGRGTPIRGTTGAAGLRNLGTHIAKSTSGPMSPGTVSRVATGMGIGGLFGQGHSEAELTGDNPDYLGSLADTGLGAVIGGGAATIPGKVVAGGGLGYLAARDDISKGNYKTAAAKVAGGIGTAYALPKAIPTRAAPMGILDRVRDLYKSEARPDAARIVKAAESLPGKPKVPSYLVGRDRDLKDAVNVQLDGPFLGSRSITKEVEPLRTAVRKRGEALVRDAGPDAPEAAGRTVAKGVKEAYGKKQAPNAAIYQGIESSLQGIKPGTSIWEQTVSKLLKDLDGSPSAQAYVRKMDKVYRGEKVEIRPQVFRQKGGVQSVQGLKTFKTELGDEARASSAIGGGKNIDYARNRLERALGAERDAALRNAANKGADPSMVSDLTAANKGYGKVVRDTRASLPRSAMPLNRKPERSMNQYFDDTAARNPAKLVKDLFDGRSTEQIRNFARNYPEQWQVVRRQVLAEIKEYATVGGELNAGRLRTMVNRRAPSEELKQLLLGNKYSGWKSFDTVTEPLAHIFNPSQTGRAMAIGDRWRPLQQGRSIMEAWSTRLRAPRVPKSLDDSSFVIQMVEAAGGSKFAQSLRDAAAKGPGEYAARYYLMSQTEPDFRRLISDEK